MHKWVKIIAISTCMVQNLRSVWNIVMSFFFESVIYDSL